MGKSNLLAEATKLWGEIYWYLDLMMSSIFTKASETPAANEPQSATDPPPYFTVYIRSLLFIQCPFGTKMLMYMTRKFEFGLI